MLHRARFLSRRGLNFQRRSVLQSVAASGDGQPGTGEQEPSRSRRLQAWQVPSQAVLQQMPCQQKPLAHWLLLSQPGPVFMWQRPPTSQ
jgi:hypothetical protein